MIGDVRALLFILNTCCCMSFAFLAENLSFCGEVWIFVEYGKRSEVMATIYLSARHDHELVYRTEVGDSFLSITKVEVLVWVRWRR